MSRAPRTTELQPDIGTARLLQAALDAAPDSMIVPDPAKRLVQMNPETAAISGLTAKAVLGRQLPDVEGASALNWSPVLEMLAEDRAGEVIIRSENIGSIFDPLRRIAEVPGAVVIMSVSPPSR